MRTLPLLSALLIGACGDPAVDESQPTPDAVLGEVTVISGDTDAGFTDGPAHLARFIGVTALCLAADGETLLLSDTFAGTIRSLKLTNGEVSTSAGLGGAPGVEDGAPGRLAGPRGLACLPDGDALIADDGALRRYNPALGLTTVAGLPGQAGNADGGATTARFGYLIHAMTASPDGSRVWFADRSNNAIRAVSLADYEVSKITNQGWDGPGGLALSDDGRTLWVADTFNARLRAVRIADNTVETLATDGPVGTVQGVLVDGDALIASGFGGTLQSIDANTGGVSRLPGVFGGSFASPARVGRELVYPALGSGSIRAYHLDDHTDRLLAGPQAPFGHVDGPLAEARYELLTDLALQESADLLILADAGNSAVRRLDLADGAVDTLDFGSPFTPRGVAISPSGALVAASDLDRGLVRVHDLVTGAVTTWSDGLSGPWGLVFDGEDHLIVAEYSGRRVLRLDAAGAHTTLAGSGERGSDDGQAADATFRRPAGLALTAQTLAITDEAACTVRVLDLTTGQVSTVAGVDQDCDGRDGDQGRLAGPVAVAPAADGGWLVADQAHSALRHIAADGSLRTPLGAPGRTGGLPAGGTFSHDEAALVFVAGVARAADAVWIAGEAQVLRVTLGTGDRW